MIMSDLMEEMVEGYEFFADGEILKIDDGRNIIEDEEHGSIVADVLADATKRSGGDDNGTDEGGEPEIGDQYDEPARVRPECTKRSMRKDEYVME